MELSMEVLIKMLLALAVVGVLATVVTSSLIPAIMLAGVAYTICQVWKGLNA
jgi:hypothetical protein